MNKNTIVIILALICACGVAAASDQELALRRSRAAALERQADWKLHFESWDKLAVYSASTTNGAVVTTHMIPVENIAKALEQAPSGKDLAVVIVSHRFYSHFDKQAQNAQINQLNEKIKASGFKRVVFLTETAVGNLTNKEWELPTSASTTTNQPALRTD